MLVIWKQPNLIDYGTYLYYHSRVDGLRKELVYSTVILI